MSPWSYEALTGDHCEPLYKVLIAIFVISVLINLALNLYWSWLIVRQIIRIFKRGSKNDQGFVDKSEGVDGNI